MNHIDVPLGQSSCFDKFSLAFINQVILSRVEDLYTRAEPPGETGASRVAGNEIQFLSARLATPLATIYAHVPQIEMRGRLGNCQRLNG